MTLKFKVSKVADLAVPLFVPDPSDPNNTIDSGKWTQEITFSLVPDPMRGGVGTLVLQVPDLPQVFRPGQFCEMRLSQLPGWQFD